jgi:hypothetical protein
MQKYMNATSETKIRKGFTGQKKLMTKKEKKKRISSKPNTVSGKYGSK